jgi:hypothetical protein
MKAISQWSIKDNNEQHQQYIQANKQSTDVTPQAKIRTSIDNTNKSYLYSHSILIDYNKDSNDINQSAMTRSQQN